MTVLRGGQDAPRLTAALTKAAADFAAGVSAPAADLPAPIQVALMRVLCGLFNEAMWARHDGVAHADAIDTAMTYGVNYPNGPFNWMATFAPTVVDSAFDALVADVSASRFTRP